MSGMALMGLMQAGFSVVGGLQESKQIKVNAKIQSQDIMNRMIAMRQAGTANALRESKIGTSRLANLESGYATSGVEMTGDIAAYLSEVAATQEANAQQRNQDLFYQLSVMEVQRQNMNIAAKSASKSAMLSAISGGVAGGAAAYDTYSENAAYWKRFGPAADDSDFGADVQQDAFRGGLI